MMSWRKRQTGFTIVEVTVALGILAMFLTIFFQLWLTIESQRVLVLQRAAAHDIASTNLNKYTNKSSINTVGCNSTNDLTVTANREDANFRGTRLTSFDPSENGDGKVRVKETVTAPLPAEVAADASESDRLNPKKGTLQSIYVFYPRGCDGTSPTGVRSVVEFSHGSLEEKVEHVIFVD